MTTGKMDELIAALVEIPDRLDALARRAEGASRSPGMELESDDWSASEVVGHLVDAARYWGARMRRVVYEQSPALDPYDENLMVRLAAYRYWPLDVLLREFRLLSQDTVAFLRALPAEAWDRTGTHETRGILTLHQVVEIEAEHEQNHARQLGEALRVGDDSQTGG
jgi:hypothetical protein